MFFRRDEHAVIVSEIIEELDLEDRRLPLVKIAVNRSVMAVVDPQ
jgi:hypothetical protein